MRRSYARNPPLAPLQNQGRPGPQAHRAESHLPSAPSVPKATAVSTFPARGDKKQVEEGLGFTPKFDADGLMPAMAIDATTKEPLMLAYMNAESLQLTLEKGEAVYWSRSRQEIWHKGATSGHVQNPHRLRSGRDRPLRRTNRCWCLPHRSQRLFLSENRHRHRRNELYPRRQGLRPRERLRKSLRNNRKTPNFAVANGGEFP